MRAKLSNVLLAAVIAGLAGVSAACGDFIRQDRSPVTLVIDALQAASGQSTTFTGTLQSDVMASVGETRAAVSDTGRVTMRLIMKDVGTAPSSVNAVTIERYRVSFRRADGLNAPGVDIPFPVDSAVTFTVGQGGSPVTQLFELVPSVTKAAAPLNALAGRPTVISTIANVSFYGRDQAGNEISVTGTIGVQFGDF